MEAAMEKSPTVGSGQSLNSGDIYLRPGLQNNARRRRVAYYACLIGFIFPATGLQVSMRIILNLIPKYQWFVFQSGMMGFLPLSIVAMMVQYYWSARGSRHNLWSLSLVWQSFVMGLLDGLANFCVIVGSTHTNMALQTLIPQAVIPLTMVLSYFFLSATFNWKQFLGAAFIVFASVVVVIPMFQGEHSLLFMTILGLSNIPMALSGCYKQAVLQEDTGVFVLSTYITFFQIIWGFAFVPLNALPGLNGCPVSEVPAQLSGGFQCIAGIGAGCESVALPWFIFVFSVFLMNVLMLGVMKFGSAAACFVVYGMVLPISNAITAMPWIMKDFGGATPLTVYTVVACFMCLVGLILYALEDAPEEDQAGNQDNNVALACGFQIHGISKQQVKVEQRRVRMSYISRVGISPMSSPEFRRRLYNHDRQLFQRMSEQQARVEPHVSYRMELRTPDSSPTITPVQSNSSQRRESF